jgi:separase
MASKDPSTRARTETVKADLRSISTCSNATVATLQDLLSKKDDAPPQKENARAKAQTTVRRKAAAATTTTADTAKPAANLLAPRERYILATEVANTTLKSLADALKSPPTVPAPPPSASSRQKPTPSEDARKPAKARTGHAKSASVSKRPLAERSASQMANSSQKPAARRSSSYSSFLTPGPDAGLVATAECARIAFAYLGTPEATKVLGKGSPELQLENGVLALVGKLIALGLDNLAIKEMRILKKRLEKYLGLQGVPPASECVKRSVPSTVPVEKESLASLLDFGTVERESIALPLIASLQTHALRLIAKLNRPRIVEATWEYLQFSNPSSPVNLICHTATTPTGQAKAARQLESLAQTILALCPSISSSHDEKPLQPSPETALLLQQLAFRVRRRWWALAKHQGNEEQEILEPFTKCLVAFTRRSQLPASKKYRLAESLYAELIGDQQQPQANGRKTGAVDKTLSALAQSAGFSEEALRWLGSSETSSPSTASEAKRIARLVRIATLSIEAYAQGDTHTGNSGLEERITDALDALKGNLGGSSVDLDHLFMEVNALRRATTRLLIARSPASLDSGTSATSEQRAVAIVASSVHFSTRFVGAKVPQTSESTVQQRHSERITTVWKCIKSIIDSVVVCCKQNILTEDQWKELDVMLQECSHILQRFEERVESGSGIGCQDHEQLQSLIVKLSTAYWAVNLSLRKSKADIGCIITAMQRSISLLLSTSQDTKNAGHLTMKLEQLGDTLESLAHARSSRDAFKQCIRAHLESDASEHLSTSTPKASLQIIFDVDGPLSILARVLKSHHRTYIKFGLTNSDELAFFDDCKLLPGIRGALLEWQLSLYLQTLGRNRQWDSTLNSSISTLVLRLQEMYESNKYPVRRLRLTSGLLQLFQSQENILPKESLPPKLPSMNPSDIAGSEDEGLARFWPHLNALCSLKLSMQLESPPTTTLRECFSTWESLIDSAPSWEQVVDCLDNPETWIQDVEACVEFLNAKGEEYLALPVLQLLVKVGDLRRSSDTSPLVLNLCSLGLQFLRLGYTGKAGMAFAKAEALLERQPLSTEARIRWCIAYAEYLARIGNTTKW